MMCRLNFGHKSPACTMTRTGNQEHLHHQYQIEAGWGRSSSNCQIRQDTGTGTASESASSSSSAPSPSLNRKCDRSPRPWHCRSPETFPVDTTRLRPPMASYYGHVVAQRCRSFRPEATICQSDQLLAKVYFGTEKQAKSSCLLQLIVNTRPTTLFVSRISLKLFGLFHWVAQPPTVDQIKLSCYQFWAPVVFVRV